MKSFLSLIVALGLMVIVVPSPRDPAMGIVVENEIVKKVIVEELGQYGVIIEDIKSTDIRYVLYPSILVLAAIADIPNRDLYRWQGTLNSEFTDCDDRAQWNNTWLRLLLPGCASFWVIGHIVNGTGHAFVGVATKEREIIWVGGSPLDWDVFQDIRLEIRRAPL